MSVDRIRVGLAIPHRYGQCHIALVRTLDRLDFSGMEVRLMDHARSSIVDNRNALVQAFLDMRPAGTHLFFIDTDVSVHRAALKKLLSADRPIISGVYVDKKDLDFVVRRRQGDYDYRSVRPEWAKYPRGRSGPAWIIREDLRDRVLPCDAAGAGCLLIERKVLEKMPYPWFFHDFNPDAREQKPGNSLSSDISFFKKAAGHGFSGYVHTGVLCYHWQGMRRFPPFWSEPEQQNSVEL